MTDLRYKKNLFKRYNGKIVMLQTFFIISILCRNLINPKLKISDTDKLDTDLPETTPLTSK